ncbi:MAG: conjugal transfer protein TraF [Methylococcales bacterium]
MKYIITICIFVFLSNYAIASEKKIYYKDTGKSFFNDRNRGWASYEDPLIEEINEDELKDKESVSTPVEIPVLSPREILKKQGEDWENTMATAILNPNNETIRDYLSHTQKIMEQSQTFATGFKQALWVTPEFDYKLENPVNTQAIFAKNIQTNESNDELLYKLADENAILFFFRSDCPHCHRFAPILKKFAEQYNITVIPMSLDGGRLPEFENPRMNNLLAQKLNVKSVPAVFLLDPESNKTSTASYGYQGWSSLKKRILFASAQLNGTSNLAIGDVR